MCNVSSLTGRTYQYTIITTRPSRSHALGRISVFYSPLQLKSLHDCYTILTCVACLHRNPPGVSRPCTYRSARSHYVCKGFEFSMAEDPWLSPRNASSRPPLRGGHVSDPRGHRSIILPPSPPLAYDNPQCLRRLPLGVR